LIFILFYLFKEELLLHAYEVTGSALAEIQKTSDISHLIKDKKNTSPMVKTTVHDLKVDCFAYDVAKDPVTVHIPVVRLFVGKSYFETRVQRRDSIIMKFI
jgi:hypothetical protein